MGYVPGAGSSSITEFCCRHSISRATFYRHRDEMPRTITIGGQVRILDRDENEWVERKRRKSCKTVYLEEPKFLNVTSAEFTEIRLIDAACTDNLGETTGAVIERVAGVLGMDKQKLLQPLRVRVVPVVRERITKK